LEDQSRPPSSTARSRSARKYTTKVKGYAPEAATITRIEPPRLWTSVVGRPSLTVTVEHVIEPVDDETLITERWIMSGPLATLVPLLLGWRIRSALAAGTAHFARLAEARTPGVKRRVGPPRGADMRS
jgi:hypothetical protein